jgi:iron complex transport system ATP-binding protein
MSDTEPVVELEGVVVRVDGRTILGPVDLVIRRHERWVLLGPNGGGKTTLLGVVGARRQPSYGRARVLGTTLGRGDIRALHGRISHTSHVLAELIPTDLPAETVVLTGKRMILTPWFQQYDDGDHRRADDLLRALGCGHLIGRRFSTASQGERQRVLLARALFIAPELMILDEPASGLDLPAREALIASLEAVTTDNGPTSIVATHHLEEVAPSSTHAALLKDGRLVAAGVIDDVLTPSLFEQTFGLVVEIGRQHGRWWAAAAVMRN